MLDPKGGAAIRVLYVGAADLAQPTAGLDLACRSHFEEISDDPRLAVTAISVSPLPIDPAVPPRRPATLLPGELATLTDGKRRLWKKLALLGRGGILFHTGLISDRARAMIKTALATTPDVLLLDNVGAMSNIALPRLVWLRLRGRTRIMVVAHDTSAEVLRDRAALQASKLRAALIRLHALHCHGFEALVFRLAHRVIFLSETDRARFGFLPAAKTQTLCVLADTSAEPQAVTAEAPYLLFVGSPGFFANAYAIEWLEAHFAPRLQALMPELPILLVGKNTDQGGPARPTNLRGLGFVSEARLHALLRGAAGLLCPVIHGSGIKIKVLEALAAGCAVFATQQSLRGYEFMGLEALLDIGDPGGSVERVIAIVADSARLADYRQHTQARWAEYTLERRGKLADAVHRLATSS